MRDADATAPRAALLFLHSSDELYGADRILLDIAGALTPDELDRAEFWLPTDVDRESHPLRDALQALGATARYVDLPVLRRAYRTPLGLARLVARAARLVLTLRRRRPALVYCSTSAVLPVAPLARWLGVPRVVGHVQEIWGRSDSMVLRPLAHACHALLAISEPVRQALPPSLHGRTSVVLNATRPPARLRPLEGRDGPLRFVVASRWNAWKGHRTLLSAWDRAGAPGRLTVLGGPPPSGEAVDVTALVRGLRDPGSVDLVGEVDDIEAHLLEADVVLVPSDQPEPFGLVAVEAFARGRPVIGSAAGGLGDIVTDEVDGWTYPLGVADVLDRLDRPRVAEAGAAARETYERRFTAERYAADWRSAVRPPPHPAR